jgi:hypothetical protein
VPPASAEKYVRPQRTALPDVRLRHLARQVHSLGERPLFELLKELAAGADPVERFERYARLPADVIAAHGGDVFQPHRLIEGGRL